MKKLTIWFVLILCLNVTAQKNLVLNGGFESDLNYWNGSEIAKISIYEKKSGKASCIISQFVGAQWKSINQVISIPKKTVAIEFSGWIKTDAIEKGKNDWNTGKFDIEFLKYESKSIKNETIASFLGSSNWTFYKKIIQVPESATKFKIMLALGETNGTLLFDDLKAVALTKEEFEAIEKSENTEVAIIEEKKQSDLEIKYLELINGNFENQTSSWRGNASVSTSVFKEGKAALQLTSNSFNWTGIDQIADVPKNATSVTVSGWLKSDDIKQGKDTWNNGLLNIEFTDGSSTKTGDDQNITFITNTTDWTFYSKTFTLPKNTQKYRIMIALGFATGTLYADEISVTFK
ncbi:carbohydrate binding domain-containing protein [Flavobacterium sp. HNIBRBA15423]|uniref:carbohydrate binding domain-containing protein n=1 Tax=Flavobacterium sp. HNIBRBA15423 TaxID=3458683 RepID=UPI004044C302